MIPQEKEQLYLSFRDDADKFIFVYPGEDYMQAIKKLGQTMKYIRDNHKEVDINEFIEKYYKDLLENAEITKNRLHAVFSQLDKEE